MIQNPTSSSLLKEFSPNLFQGQAESTKTTINLTTTVGSTLRSTLDNQIQRRPFTKTKTWRLPPEIQSSSIAEGSMSRPLSNKISPDKKTPIIPPKLKFQQSSQNNRYSQKQRNLGHNIYRSSTNTEDQHTQIIVSSDYSSIIHPAEVMTSKKVRKGRRLGSGHSKHMDRSQDYKIQQNNYMAVTPSNYQSEQAPIRDEKSFNKCAPSVRKFKNNGQQ